MKINFLIAAGSGSYRGKLKLLQIFVPLYLCVIFPFTSTFADLQPSIDDKPSPPIPERLKRASIQIALDNLGFSPGLIDGREGPKTTLALITAKAAGQSIEPPAEAFTTWKIPEDYLHELSPIPESWVERSKLATLHFERAQEKIAEQFHVSENFLAYLNPKVKDWSKLREGDTLKAPLLSPNRLPKVASLRISLKKKIILALDDSQKVFASFPCSIAAKKEKRPAGKLEVQALAQDPDYLFDPALFPEVPEAATITSKLMIAPGPNNPVGEMWIGLNLKGYGMHGTPHPEDIGKTESHGCFRLTNWDAKRLGTMVKVGTPVIIELE